MKRLEHILLIALLSAAAVSATAQRNTVSVGWGASIPAGRGNFVDKASPASVSAEWEYHILPHLSAGVRAGYVGASENRRADRIGDDVVDSKRSFWSVPLAARLHFFPLGQKSLFRPWIAASAGAQYARFDITGEAINRSGANNWGGLFSAGAGVRCYPFRARGFFVEAAGEWQWTGNRFEVVEVKSGRSVELRLGVGFSM